MHGVLNFLKPPGMTSHDAVAFVRRTFNTKRVGHTGTLDPAAAGVLPICIGQATRLVEYLQAGRKTYIAEITFGIETDTLDATGEVVSTSDASHVHLENLRATLDQFRGTISQMPPMYSAIKRDGKKLYELAREGVDEAELDIQPRQVEIYSLVVPRDFASSTRTRAMLRIECGSGTYIRSLVRDIGRALGCGATMSFLVRTQNGAFSIDEAHTPEEVLAQGGNAVTPIQEALRWCVRAPIEDDAATEQLAKGQTTQAISIERAWRNEYKGYEIDSDILGKLKTKASRNGVDMNSKRAAFYHSDGKTLVLASAVDETTYKSEKVFFLDRDE
jgi:tRNA pseudouridine55 synthase